MIKVKRIYIFVLFIIVLMFLGLQIANLRDVNFEDGGNLFWKLSPIYAPILTSLALFYVLYINKKR
ncbi:hypothetical protein [Rasiella sp. SM2506]|uniref:hypothetical protein n=1 Tax=Rasiella sp. SM2506 TaxID=3423914 RepID=UPI003D7BF01C